MERNGENPNRRRQSLRLASGVLAALVVVLFALPGAAEAGWRKSKPSRPHRGAEKALPLRHAPRLEYLVGTLSCNAAGDWSLDGRRLLLRDGFQVVGAGEHGRAGGPVAGLRVLVSGTRTTRGFQTQAGVALRPAPPTAPRGDGARTVIWSDTDPKVGVGNGPGRS